MYQFDIKEIFLYFTVLPHLTPYVKYLLTIQF